MFNDALQPVLYELKDAIAKKPFEQKGKFPPSLKPMLMKVALQAIVLLPQQRGRHEPLPLPARP